MKSLKETLTGRARPEQLVQTSLKNIARKAKREKKYRFRDLYRQINYGALKLAWLEINKKAAAGVDKITATEFEKNLEENLQNILESLKEKRYHAKLVRRKYIDKGNGKKRPLGIPALKDKIVQRAVTDILEAIFEQDFIEDSYGYRPNKSAKKAVINLSEELNFGQYNYIVEADIKGFFDNIDHDWLIKMLEQRIDDKQLIRLIKKWLKAGILEEDNEIVYPKAGTPQGGIISPVLANIYLHFVLDNWFKKVIKEITEGDTYFLRYADDYITAFRYRKDAEYFYSKMQKRLNKFRLKLSLEKSNIILFSRFKKQGSKRFEFLGFEFSRSTSLRGKDIIKRRTSRKKLRKSIKNFKEWCKMMRNQKLKTLFKKLNAKLRGYYNYYGLIGNYDSLEEFFNISLKILYKWLNRRSQRRSMNWDKFKEIIGWYNVCKPRIVEKINRQLRLNFA